MRSVAPFALASRIDSSMRSRLPRKSSGTLGRVAAATVMYDMGGCLGGWQGELTSEFEGTSADHV